MKTKIILPILLLGLVVSCVNLIPSHPRISARKAGRIHPIREWELYSVIAIDWAADSKHFAVAGLNVYDGDEHSPNIFSYDIENPEVEWANFTYGGLSLTYTPDGSAIAVPELFGGANLLDAKTGMIIENINDPVMEKGQCIGRMDIEYSPDSAKMITMDSDIKFGSSTTVFIWDTRKNECLGKLLNEQGSSFDFEMSQDGKRLAIMLRDVPIFDAPGKAEYFGPQVQVWDLENRTKVCAFSGGNAAFDPGGKFIASADKDYNGEVNIWDATSCALQYSLGRKGMDPFYGISLAISPDGKLLAIGGSSAIQIWNLANRKLLFESESLQNNVEILTFSPDGKYLISETVRVTKDDKAIITLWGVER
ncbi:MAG: WD40 repeat domain-containing protein [Chloroflexota bacterium]